MTLETIVRPFSIDQGVTPVRTVKAGQRGVEPVLVMVGRRGGTKTLPYSGNFSLSSYMVRIHKEKGNLRELLGE